MVVQRRFGEQHCGTRRDVAVHTLQVLQAHRKSGSLQDKIWRAKVWAHPRKLQWLQRVTRWRRDAAQSPNKPGGKPGSGSLERGADSLLHETGRTRAHLHVSVVPLDLLCANDAFHAMCRCRSETTTQFYTPRGRRWSLCSLVTRPKKARMQISCNLIKKSREHTYIQSG